MANVFVSFYIFIYCIFCRFYFFFVYCHVNSNFRALSFTFDLVWAQVSVSVSVLYVSLALAVCLLLFIVPSSVCRTFCLYEAYMCMCVCVWVCMWMCLCVACSCHLTVNSNYHLIYRCHRYGCRLSVPQLDCSTFWARFVEVNLLRKRKPLPYTVILALIFGQKEEDSTTCWRFANKQTGES